jgi:hypothetical protein
VHLPLTTCSVCMHAATHVHTMGHTCVTHTGASPPAIRASSSPPVCASSPPVPLASTQSECTSRVPCVCACSMHTVATCTRMSHATPHPWVDKHVAARDARLQFLFCELSQGALEVRVRDAHERARILCAWDRVARCDRCRGCQRIPVVLTIQTIEKGTDKRRTVQVGTHVWVHILGRMFLHSHRNSIIRHAIR